MDHELQAPEGGLWRALRRHQGSERPNTGLDNTMRSISRSASLSQRQGEQRLPSRADGVAALSRGHGLERSRVCSTPPFLHRSTDISNADSDQRQNKAACGRLNSSG